ncbi:MAG: paraquat-inducible protein A [Pseudomonadota bacterium]
MIRCKSNPLDRTLAFSGTAILLVVILLVFPFLSMARSGFSNEASVPQIIELLAYGWYYPLALAVGVFVLVIPTARSILLFSVILRLKFRHDLVRTKKMFRLSEGLMPWSMAEIFLVGAGVALVKIADLAQVGFDVAFWLYCTLVIVLALANNAVCRWTVWSILQKEAGLARN